MRKNIDQLSGLRGFAALLVFISHSANIGILPSFLGFGLGQVGVMIFFVLSGFLMGYLYLERAPDLANVLQFSGARVGRVLPLYWTVLIISLALSSIFPWYYYDFTNPRNFIAAFLLIFGRYELWTVAVEVQFYTLFVGYWIVARRYIHNDVALAVVAFVASCFLAFGLLSVIGKGMMILPFSLPYFATGLVFASLHGRIEDLRLSRALNTILGLGAIIVLIASTPANLHALGLADASTDLIADTWLNPICFAAIVLLFFSLLKESALSDAFKCRPMLFMGGISYGFYLMHRPILEALTFLPGPLTLVVSFCAVLALSTLSFYCFETPTASAVRRAVDSLQARLIRNSKQGVKRL